MGFFDRFRRKQQTEIVPEPRDDRATLQQRRLELQEKVLREHRAAQIGDEAVFPTLDPIDPYRYPTDERLMSHLGIPPRRFYIRQGESGFEIVQKEGLKPLFSPENRPETLVQSEKLFDRGIEAAKKLTDEEI